MDFLPADLHTCQTATPCIRHIVAERRSTGQQQTVLIQYT